MKFLILILLFSCGKHEKPKAVDLNDSDGDQIPNYQEDEYGKYIANFEALKTVRGVIKYSAVTQGEVSFSNYQDTKDETIKLLIGDNEKSKEEFFSEWSHLRLELPEKNVETVSNSNTLHLYFEPTEIKPNELVLIKGNTFRTFGLWSEHMRLQISKEEFIGLMNGKMTFALRKKFNRSIYSLKDTDVTIIEKTYKVYFDDGQRSEILYVSKELPLEKLLAFLKIDSPIKITDESLFFNSKEQGQSQWFQRDYSNGDKAFGFLPINQLKESFLSKFKTTKINLRRENGSPINTLNLENKAGSIVYLRIRPSRVVRDFSEYTDRKCNQIRVTKHGSMNLCCDYFMRKIESEKNIPASLEDFFANLNRTFDHNKEIKYLEQLDEKGSYWEVMITTIAENINLSLAPRDGSTYAVTGQYDVQCRSKVPTRANSARYQTNEESHLSFEIESFVEKIH